MSEQEVKRLKVSGGGSLGLTVLQVRRLQRLNEASGAFGLVGRQRGEPSNRCLPEDVKGKILGRLRECHADFGLTEYLRAEGRPVSQETVRGWMIEARLWQAGYGRRVCLHPTAAMAALVR